jgi:hypothetical protein
VLVLAPEADVEVQTDAGTVTGRAALLRAVGGQLRAIAAYAFSSIEGDGVSVEAAAPYLSGDIVSCDYDGGAVLVRGIPADEALIGRPVRVHNNLRSSLHMVTAIAPEDDLTRLTLGTTALRHEGWLSAIAGSSIRDGAPSPWAFDTFLAGTRLLNEAGDSDWTVTGAAGGWWSAPTGTSLRLRAPDGGPASADGIRDSLTDADGNGVAEFLVYEYGAGDRVEIASYAHLERQENGEWAGEVSPGVTVRRP